MSLRNILIVLAVIIFVSLAYGALRLFYFVRISGDVVGRSRAYQQHPEDADMKILVMGDSTAFGTGAKDPANSVAGRLGQDFPNAEITNLAENGMKTDELRRRLDEFLADGEYDLVVIHIGANDVLRLKDLDQTKQNIRAIVERSLQQSKYLGLFTSGNIGDAKLIPWFARPLMSYRSRQLRYFGVELDSELNNMVYVDLYYKDAGIPDERFYAEDMLHLSGEGYGFWYRELKAALQEETDLY